MNWRERISEENPRQWVFVLRGQLVAHEEHPDLMAPLERTEQDGDWRALPRALSDFRRLYQMATIS
jgi:hypothetical protein